MYRMMDGAFEIIRYIVTRMAMFIILIATVIISVSFVLIIAGWVLLGVQSVWSLLI